jgi:hypothetical protein
VKVQRKAAVASARLLVSLLAKQAAVLLTRSVRAQRRASNLSFEKCRLFMAAFFIDM